MAAVACRCDQGVNLYAWPGNSPRRPQGGMSLYLPPIYCTGSRRRKANILIDNNGHACISDFSLLTIVSDPQTFLSTCMSGGTAPWMSPEILDPEGFGLKESRLTKESDCYALGMVIYEILSGRAPFASSLAPILKILRGDRPERPQGAEGVSFTDGIWRMLERCWNTQPSKRISAETVLLCLEGDSPPSWLDANDQSGVTTASDFSAFSLFRQSSQGDLHLSFVMEQIH